MHNQYKVCPYSLTFNLLIISQYAQVHNLDLSKRNACSCVHLKRWNLDFKTANMGNSWESPFHETQDQIFLRLSLKSS